MPPMANRHRGKLADGLLLASLCCLPYKNLMNTSGGRGGVTSAILFVCRLLFPIDQRISTSKRLNKGSSGEGGERLCKTVQRLAAPHDSPRAISKALLYRSSLAIIRLPETEDGNAAGGRTHHLLGPWPAVTPYLFGKSDEAQYRDSFD